MLENFIRSNFDVIVEIQENFGHDIAMVKAVESKTLNNEMVKNWMRNYGLFQGVKGEYRVKIADEFIQFSNGLKRENELNIEANFKVLHSKLYSVFQRKWLSATSKLLWCIYPNKIVIYDAFVERVITVLQCLDEDLAKLPRLNYPPNIKSKKDIELVAKYYMNYQNHVKLLVKKHQLTLNELKVKLNTNYKYDLRIIDKILWLMGDMKSEFKLGDIHCKTEEIK